jgi:AcrR family transcriptional regulator
MPTKRTSDRDPRPGGRPRDLGIDEAILVAAEELLAERGVAGVTVKTVAARIGVPRTTVYRRWPDSNTLVAGVLRRAMGVDRDPLPVLPGDTAIDLLYAGAEKGRAIYEPPEFRALLPRFVAGLIAPADSPGHLVIDEIMPLRMAVAAAYRSGAAASGLRDDLDPELVVDVISGAILQRLLTTGAPPDSETTRAIVDIVVSGLRVRPPGDGGA